MRYELKRMAAIALKADSTLSPTLIVAYCKTSKTARKDLTSWPEKFNVLMWCCPNYSSHP